VWRFEGPAEGTATTILAFCLRFSCRTKAFTKIFSTLLIRQVPPRETNKLCFFLPPKRFVHQANFTYSMDDITETAYLKIEFGPASFRIAPRESHEKSGHHIRMIFSCIDYL